MAFRPPAPGASSFPVSISATINQRDITRLTKRLDKWHGKPLATRMQKAEQAGLALYIGALRARAAKHNVTGATQRGYAVRKLRTKAGEVAAYKVSSNTRHRHFAIVGTNRGVEADPYVESVHGQLEPTVTAFITDQIRRLA